MTGVLGRVWLAAAALCGGTFWGAAGGSRPVAVAAVISGSIAMMTRRRFVASLAGIVMLCAGAGMLNAQERFGPRGPLGQLAKSVAHCEFRGTILESAGGLGTLVEIGRATCGGWSGDSLGVAAVRDEVGAPGEDFEADGWLIPLATDGFGMSLRRLGAEAALHPSKVSVLSSPRGAHGVAARVRRGLDVAVAGIGPEAGALIKGLTIGDTSGFGSATIDLFRRAGLSHILAVSGSNVAIVLGAVLAGSRAAGHSVRILFGYIGLALFVLIVGPDASVLRAAAMGSIVLACIAYGRTAEPLAALGLAVIGVIALRPGMLFSVGMQLSTAATAGIIIFCGPLENRLQRIPPPFRTMIAATLAAQIAVAPILVLVFEEFSVIAPVANALALPAVAPGTVVGLAAGVISVPMPDVGYILALVVSPAAKWILFVAERAGSVSWSLVHVPAPVGWPVLLAVASWAVIVLRSPRKPAG